jgi:hypothetical protein
MYTPNVKRLQIYIDEELDAALAVESRRRGTSKAALIRQYVGERIGNVARPADPIDRLVGVVEGTRDESASVDAVVYGSR